MGRDWVYFTQFIGSFFRMKHIIYFIILPILLTVVGEFLLKFAVQHQSIGLDINSLLIILASPKIILGVTLIGVSAILWIIGMSKFQLSFMYPFLSLNYGLIIVGSDLILNENVSFNRYLSIGLIAIGLIIISRSNHIKIKESS
jgi:multidrug transporter EmrE-like cation transporter